MMYNQDYNNSLYIYHDYIDTPLCVQTGVVPLHIACDKGNILLAKLLIEAGADLDIATTVCYSVYIIPVLTSY